MHYSNKQGMTRILCVIILSVLALGGCATTSGPAVDGEAHFPDISDAWREGGTFVNVDNLRQMNMGLTKPQVRDLIGGPHFQEGFFGVHVWNYIFNFRTGPQPQDYVTCQYQVHFDSDMRTDGLYWRDPQCPPFRNEPKTISLDGDLLFDFDSAQLTAQGQRVVTNLGAKIQDNYDAPRIAIVGYTDRFGTAAYNQALSQQRADTVRNALAATGIAASAIRSRGAGESNPLVQCPGAQATTAVKACLQPNRRVEIQVDGGR